ncbi:hypothetical protein EI555_012306, partial [Monodon monoceros]
LSMNVGVAIPLRAGAAVLGLRNKTKASLPTTRHAHPPQPHASSYRNCQPIHPTSSTSCATNGQYYSRSFIHTSNRRSNLSANKYQQVHCSHYIHYSHLLAVLEFTVAIIQAYVPTLLISDDEMLFEKALSKATTHQLSKRDLSTDLTPTPELGGCWPPTGVHPRNPLEVLLLNTSVLLASGVSITWAHHSITEGDRKHILQALFITITLGIYFTILQASEYYGLRWGLRINFLHSHRIPQTTCNYWVYLPCCLFPAPIKIPLHIQPPLWL